MVKKLAFGLVILSGLFLMSCDPDDVNGKGTQKNYWERNAWNYEQLKGKVQVVKEFQDNSDSFNEMHFGELGELVKTRSSWQGGDVVEEVFKYNNLGQLVVDEYNEYVYGTHGKYIPRSTFHINMDGLVKNLSRIISDVDTRFEFKENTLYVYFDYERPDTMVIEYTGAYPTKIGDVNDTSTDWGEFMNASYQANGMFDVFEEGFYGTGENWYIDSRKTYYKKDNDYLLIDKIVRTYVGANVDWSTTSEEKFTYNSKKDLIHVVEYDEEGEIIYETNYEYEYDSHDNWTKQSTTYSWDEKNVQVTNREITYYE